MRGNEHVTVVVVVFLPFFCKRLNENCYVTHALLEICQTMARFGGGRRVEGAFIVMFEGEKRVLSIHKRRTDVNVN